MSHKEIVRILQELGEAVCDKVTQSLKTQSIEHLSAVYKKEKTDIIYQIDKDCESIIVDILAQYADKLGGLVLLAEGIGDEIEGLVLPSHISASEAKWRIIIDPIDGTRGIMYNKRSAFFLAGIAPNKGQYTQLSDICVALMTELPTSKAYLSDTLYTIRGEGAFAETRNLLTQERTKLNISPSKAQSILGGFAQLVRFFPPGRAIIAAIEDELIETLDPTLGNGKAIVFEDQYISTGGQLYELLIGHDRFIGDIRNTLYHYLKNQGKKTTGHVCQPYDICTLLIAQEAGLIITDIHGKTLDNIPMDLLSPVDWLGFANQDIYDEIFPILNHLLIKYQLKTDTY